MTSQPDFYGPVAETTTVQVDTITLSHTTPAALSRQAITSYPSLQAAGATPTADVIKVHDVTTSHDLVLGTDYTLTASGAGETLTYSVTRINSSSLSADSDSATVTYRYGTIPDTDYNFGAFQGEAGAAPLGTAQQASNAPTTGSTTAGVGEQAAGGSLTDPANTVKGGPETGSPGSEYAVNEVVPGTYGAPLGAPDTEGVYGGGLPENYSPVLGSNYSQGNIGSTADPNNLDTTAAGGSNLVPGMYPSPPGYRAPSSGVAASTKDTTLTDILGNQINSTPLSTDAFYAASNVDTSYVGAPAAPTSLQVQTDAFAAAQAGTLYYLTQQGLIPSSVVVTNTTSTTTMVLGTDYTITTAGNGATTVAYIVPVVAAHFANGNSISVTYSWGDPTYWDSNTPAAVPGAPSITAVTAVNRGIQVAWSPPSGTVPIDYYMLQSNPDLGTMYVPDLGQPQFYGQVSPAGGAEYGQPTYQADTLTLLSAALAAPATPTGTGNTGSGSTLAGGNYKVINTYVNSNGETTGSVSTTIAVTATDNLVINSPAAETGATGWYTYVTQVGGSTYTRQQALGSPTAIGTAVTITAPPTSTGANPPTLNTTLATTSKAGVITPPNQVVVRDTTSTEGDPMQPTGTVLEYGYDYTVTVVGVGPWTQYQFALAAGSVNAAAGDTIIIEYWYGADPSSISAVFTQGLAPNTAVIYRPDGTTPYNQGYAFKVAAGNRAGLGPYSALSAYAVPLNYNAPQPGHEGSPNVGTGSLDPANTINPIYKPDGTVKAGTGLGG